MLQATQFGGIREDALAILGPIVGTERVQSIINDIDAELRRIEARVRSEAEKGARAAIPDITLEVEATAKKVIKPWVGAAIGLSVIAAGVSIVALIKS